MVCKSCHLHAYPLAAPSQPDVIPPEPPDPSLTIQTIGILSLLTIRVIIAWGNGQFPTTRGNPAPSCSIYKKLQQTSKMLGRFPPGILVTNFRSCISRPAKDDRLEDQ
jgi:hypothetical protein